MTRGSGALFPEGAPAHGDFSEDSAVEGPAIELFQSLGWSHSNLYQEFSSESPEGRRTMREAVLPKRVSATVERYLQEIRFAKARIPDALGRSGETCAAHQ